MSTEAQAPLTRRRRMSVGVEAVPGGVHARVWAPRCATVDFVLDENGRRSGTWPLQREEDGHFSAAIQGPRTGDRYWFQLDGARLRPDPASRFQPEGPDGPSMIVDPDAYRWSDDHWKGPAVDGHVIYELHVGTFTREGTWRAAAAQLEELAQVGITLIEMMPVADFMGQFGWGYDGVALYAPTRLYGTPDDLRAFIDRAHALGMGVILDVVYNHVGPDGNFLEEFSPDYFTSKYENDWGRAINFEGPAPAREFFVANAAYWIREFHFDGLRLDATQDMHDASPEHAIASVVRTAREATSRRVSIVAENEPQDTRLVRDPAQGGYGGDLLWNDDFHHSALVALTGRREAYYHDYDGSGRELVSASKYGFLYQGQWYRWQKKRRGTPALDLAPRVFVSYIENHDQLANTPFGRRLHQTVSPSRLRALTAMMLLGPATPMLFQGQEFAASSPFLYFADHSGKLRESVASGRREFLSQFPSVTDPEVVAMLPPPTDPETFERSKLDLAERDRHSHWYDLHKDLLRLRRTDPVIRAAQRHRPDGAVLGPHAFVLRYQGQEGEGDRLLLVNLGCDLDLPPLSEPLLAPPLGSRWVVQWSSTSPRYGGSGTPPLRPHSDMHVPGESAVLLRSEPGPIDDEREDRGG